MIRLEVACTVENPVVRLQYCGGVLHSANDEPALVGKCNSRGNYISGLYNIWAATQWRHYSDVWYGYLPRKHFPRSHSRWYDRGDLHRAYGPAVVSDHYWQKYHRGVQAASRTNTYTTMPASAHRKLSKYCVDAHCTGCAILVACAPASDKFGIYTCYGCARVYQTCAGLILQFGYTDGNGENIDAIDDSDADTDSDTDTYSDTLILQFGYTDGNGENIDAIDDSDADTDSDTDTYSDTDDVDTDGDSDTDGASDADGDSDADSDADTYYCRQAAGKRGCYDLSERPFC